MHLSLSEEQQLLKDSVARFVADNYSIERLRALRDTQTPLDKARWSELAELGWLGLTFAEADGGYGCDAIDMMVLCEQFGRGLVTEPYLANIVVCGGFLRRSSDALRAAYLPDLMAGISQWAFAFAEATSRYQLSDVSLPARAHGDGFVLEGNKISVVNGAAAEQFIVSARTGGDRRDTQGVSLFIVPADAPGVTRQVYPLVDGSMGADVHFEGVELSSAMCLGTQGAAMPLIEAVIAEALVAIGAECLGAMDALLEQTVSYTQTREQFGTPISRFQSLQHRMADMYLACESLRSLLYYAAILQRDAATGARDISAKEAQKAASALKVKAGDAGRFVSQQAVQLHGGIGMTDELGISHYFKRLLLLNALFGDSEHHLQAYIAA